MADCLPVEVITQILSFVSVLDRKEAALVNTKWYEASMDPILLRDTVTTLHAQAADAQCLIRSLARRHTPHLVLENIDGSFSSKAVIASSAKLAKHLQSLSLKGSEIPEGVFVSLLSGCVNLQSLDVSCCNSLFMTGMLLHKAEDVKSLQRVLANVTTLNLSSIRYLSDVTFNRMLSICENIEKLAVAGNQIIFHTNEYYERTGDMRSRENSALLTFKNILGFLCSKSNQIKGLNFSRTTIDDEALGAIAAVEGLNLEELQVVCCREMTDDGVIGFCKKQKSLRSIDLGQTLELGDRSVACLGMHAPNLHSLSLSQCKRITGASMSKLSKLQQLQMLDLSSCQNVSSSSLTQGLCSDEPLAELTHLNISCCSAVNDDFIYAACKKLKKLTYFDLSSCSLTDLGVILICKHLTGLRTLKLAWCRNVTDFGLLGVIAEENRVHDDEDGLCKCQRTHHKSNIFNKPTKYRRKPTHVLEMENMIKEEITDESCTLSNLRNLTHLDLMACKRITDASLTQVMQFTALRSLTLSLCTAISDASLWTIAHNTPGLEELFLSQCNNITDEGVILLVQRLRRLHKIDISGCDRLSDDSLKAMRQHSRCLHHLDVSLCSQISPSAVEWLEGSMSQLQTTQKRLVGGAFVG